MPSNEMTTPAVEAATAPERTAVTTPAVEAATAPERTAVTTPAVEAATAPERTAAMTSGTLTIVGAVDRWLDSAVADTYQGQPLAQDWARVAKITEEAGEAVDALIRMTGQNPRKGVSGTLDDLLAELADAALTAILAIEHFTKDPARTDAILAASFAKVAERAAMHNVADLFS